MRRISSILAALAVVGLASSAFATSYGTNIIQVPSAETYGTAITGSTTSWGGAGANALTSPWTAAGAAGVVSADANFSAAQTPGGGSRIFTGGLVASNTGGNTVSGTATQTIDVSDLASDINSGNVGFSLSGYLGGYYGEDTARLDVIFLQADGVTQTGPTATLGPVAAADRNNAAGMVLRTGSGLLPSDARMVQVVFTASTTHSFSNGYVNGYGDQFSLSLTAPPVVPEPASLGLLGLGALALLRRR